MSSNSFSEGKGVDDVCILCNWVKLEVPERGRLLSRLDSFCHLWWRLQGCLWYYWTIFRSHGLPVNAVVGFGLRNTAWTWDRLEWSGMWALMFLHSLVVLFKAFSRGSFGRSIYVLFLVLIWALIRIGFALLNKVKEPRDQCGPILKRVIHMSRFNSN